MHGINDFEQWNNQTFSETWRRCFELRRSRSTLIHCNFKYMHYLHLFCAYLVNKCASKLGLLLSDLSLSKLPARQFPVSHSRKTGLKLCLRMSLIDFQYSSSGFSLRDLFTYNTLFCYVFLNWQLQILTSNHMSLLSTLIAYVQRTVLMAQVIQTIVLCEWAT